MKMDYKIIQDEAQYESLMEEILDIMNKGEANLSTAESEKLLKMALAAQAYEKEHHHDINMQKAEA